MNILVFCVEKPDITMLPQEGNVTVIPLRWELELYPPLPGYNLVDTAKWRSLELSNRMQQDVDDAWDSVLSGSSDPLMKDYSYYYVNVVTPILFWRHIVKSALNEFKPDIVYLPHPSQERSVTIPLDHGGSGLFYFLKWIRYQVLASEVEATQAKVRYFSEDGSFEESSKQTILRNLSRVIDVESYYLASRLISRTLEKTQGIINRFLPLKTETRVPQLLILGQPSKCTFLRRLLEHNDIPYIYQDYAAFNKSICGSPTTTLQLTLRFEPGIDIEKLVVAWLDELIKINRNLLSEKISLFAEQAPHIILTDAQHDPLVRRFISESSLLDKRVVIYPEGLGHNTGEIFIFNRKYLHLDLPIFRFTVSREELILTEAEMGPGIATGYLGDTFDYVKDSQTSVGIALRSLSSLRFRERKSFAGVVFFDLDLHIDTGVNRAYFRPDSQALGRAITGIRALIDAGYKVIANLRYYHFYDLLIERISSKNFVLYMLAPWQLLIKGADVVVIYQSSLGLESLAHNKPVVVWDPFDYPAFPDAWSGVGSDVVRVVSVAEDLAKAVNELILSPKKDFDKYERFFAKSQEKAIDWIKEAVMDCNSKMACGNDSL